MSGDERVPGRLLGRREALAWLATGACVLAVPTRAATMCVTRPEQTEGPFYVDERLERSDIRRDPGTGQTVTGTPLALAIGVARLSSGRCAPLADARVDVWQCDAQGRYSDVDGGGGSTVGRRFLRGYQVTDASGTARFVTIVPGWYAGRTVHIHVRIDATDAAGKAQRFTSQLYFDDALVDRVHASAPYAGRRGARRRNRDDPIWRSGGDRLMLAAEPSGEGYSARFELGLDGG
jgi:protocatechuate 3,4-dioxygenase beta subunit